MRCWISVLLTLELIWLKLYVMLFKGIFISLFVFACHGGVSAQEKDPLSDIQHILTKPDAEIDIARAMLTISKIVDPSVDIDAYMLKIDGLVDTLQGMAGDREVSLKDINQLMYEKGPWNNNQEYTYNLDDPFGKDIKNHMLSNFLDTKVGNCVSMPMLYYILGRRFNYQLFISTAPSHLFVQGLVKDGLIGIETTRKAKSWPLEAFKKQWTVTETAKKNKLYFQRLPNKGIISQLLNAAVIHFIETKEYKLALRTSALAMKYRSKNYSAMINMSAALARMIDEGVYIQGLVPPSVKTLDEYYLTLDRRYEALRKQAKRLGYRKFTDEERAEILDRIERLKTGVECV